MKHLSKLTIMLLIAVISFGTVGCKNKQKLAEQQAAAALSKKTNNAKSSLRSLLANTAMSIADKEQALNKIKAMGLKDPQVLALIKQVQTQIDDAKAAKTKAKADADAKTEADRIAAEKEKARRAIEAEKMKDADYYFKAIAEAKDVNQANAYIKDALKLFSSPDAPVLLIVYKKGDVIDYDKPTTISKYLNHIKDLKKYIKRADRVIKKGGKITSIDLIDINK